MFLLDANVLIRAHEDYYGLNQVPQFWEWLLGVAEVGAIKVPAEIFDEIAISTGELGEWIRQKEVRNVLVLNENVNRTLLSTVVDRGYASDLTDTEIEQIGRDPFLIAYALASADRTVVTKEVSAPSKVRANRRIPDVCSELGVKCAKDFDVFRELGFRVRRL